MGILFDVKYVILGKEQLLQKFQHLVPTDYILCINSEIYAVVLISQSEGIPSLLSLVDIAKEMGAVLKCEHATALLCSVRNCAFPSLQMDPKSVTGVSF